MSKRRRSKPAQQKHHADRDDQATAEPVPQADESEAWNTPEFRNKLLIDLAFVAAPAIIMLLLGQRIWAAAWFGVGVLVIIWQFWGQIRAFVRSFRAGDQPEDEEQA